MLNSIWQTLRTAFPQVTPRPRPISPGTWDAGSWLPPHASGPGCRRKARQRPRVRACGLEAVCDHRGWAQPSLETAAAAPVAGKTSRSPGDTAGTVRTWAETAAWTHLPPTCEGHAGPLPSPGDRRVTGGEQGPTGLTPARRRLPAQPGEGQGTCRIWRRSPAWGSR